MCLLVYIDVGLYLSTFILLWITLWKLYVKFNAATLRFSSVLSGFTRKDFLNFLNRNLIIMSSLLKLEWLKFRQAGRFYEYFFQAKLPDIPPSSLSLYKLYTVSQKRKPLDIDNNFDKCGAIFNILLPTNSWETCLCTNTKTSTSPAMCCYITLWKSEIQKC